jgi:hypothetical protein
VKETDDTSAISDPEPTEITPETELEIEVRKPNLKFQIVPAYTHTHTRPNTLIIVLTRLVFLWMLAHDVGSNSSCEASPRATVGTSAEELHHDQW